MELPNPPFYRRWSFILASIIGLAAVMALLGWRGLAQVASVSSAVSIVPVTTVPGSPTTLPPSSIGPTSKPDKVLWAWEGSDVKRSPGFRAPDAWRIEWSFDCGNFADLGGGNFKITGDGAFDQIQIQAFNTEASGTRTFTRGGFGYLLVDSVCDQWSVKALSS